MGKLGPIFMIGFGVVVSGLYYHLWDDAIVFMQDYIISDDYYALIRFVWDAIPVVILLVGIIWLIREGTSGSSGGVVYQRGSRLVA